MNIYKKQNTIWQKLLFGGLALLFLIIVLNVFPSPIKNAFYGITSPIQSFFWNTGNNSSVFFGSFFRGGQLQKDNDRLTKENQDLLSKVLSLQDQLAQNQALKEVMQNTATDQISLLAVQTVGLDATYDIISINRGRSDGVLEKMPVISSTKVLIGRVVKVYQHFSEVMLISSKNSVVDAKILQSDATMPSILGVVKGSSNLSLYLDLVPTDATLNRQDTLVTSGLEGIFPKDLLIGTITSKTTNDLKPYQTAIVQPFFDIRRLGTLFVIKDYLR